MHPLVQSSSLRLNMWPVDFINFLPQIEMKERGEEYLQLSEKLVHLATSLLRVWKNLKEIYRYSVFVMMSELNALTSSHGKILFSLNRRSCVETRFEVAGTAGTAHLYHKRCSQAEKLPCSVIHQVMAYLL